MPGEFEPTADNQALKEQIIARIRAEGAISFRDFMAMALYQPQLGYYCSPGDKMGRAGDYLTSPEVSPVFGTLIGRQLREMWEVMGRPASFRIVEAGAGNGTLCRDLLRWARRTEPGFFEAVDYRIVEVSARLVERQREALAAEPEIAERVRWDERLPARTEGCIFSNELLDSMPVHRLRLRDGRLQEIYVGWDGQRLVEEMRPPSPEVSHYFGRLGLLPGEGCAAEVNLEALEWVRQAGGALERGFLLTLDYGYEAAELYAPWRREGTLLCFYHHNPGTDPYARIGRQDMTSHVDFTSVRRAGEETGLETLGLTTQSEFLANLGIAEAASPPNEGDVGLEDYFARRRAVIELVDPAALGRIRVLVQAKQVGQPFITGLGGSRP